MASRQSCFAVRSVSKMVIAASITKLLTYVTTKTKKQQQQQKKRKKQSVKLCCLWSPLMTSWGCHAMLRIGEEHCVTTLLMAAKRTSLIKIDFKYSKC